VAARDGSGDGAGASAWAPLPAQAIAKVPPEGSSAAPLAWRAGRGEVHLAIRLPPRALSVRAITGTRGHFPHREHGRAPMAPATASGRVSPRCPPPIVVPCTSRDGSRSR
jgi:hypothetical protein